MTTTYQLTKRLSTEPQAACLRFVFVSDLHNVSIGNKNQELIRAIELQNPDAVLIGGDTLVGKPGYPMDVAIDFIKNVAGRYPVYYANGNHEYRLRIYPDIYGDMYERFSEAIKEAGVHYLINQTARINVRGIPVAIHGFEADKKYYQRYSKADMPVFELNQIFGQPDPNDYHILLAHNPEYRETYLNWGADLALSGHCHGGVIRFGEHYGLISPNFNLIYKYCHGRFDDAYGRTMIVSAGLGEHTIPLRFFNPRELVTLEIQFIGK